MDSIVKKILLFSVSVALFSCSGGEEKQKESDTNDTFPEVLAVAPDTAQVIKNGEYKDHYPNGVIKAKGFYMNGKRNGEWFSYYENGKVWSYCVYKDGICNGKITSYFSSGKVFYDGQYKNGKKAGKWKFYREDGTLEKEQDFGNGD